MGQNSNIEWTTHTFNPWRGCTKVSEGCKHCYADSLSKRNPKTLGVWGPNGTRVVAAESAWREPLKWNAAAERAGERHRVFCASLADVFEGEDTMPADSWPAVEAARARLFELICQTPDLDWLLLTKRPENIMGTVFRLWDSDRVVYGARPMLDDWWRRKEPPANVWLGTSVENQKAADERHEHLRRCPAVVRFYSAEPLLGPIDKMPLDGISWVIVGGESGGSARPMHPMWVERIRRQCASAGVSFFFKQWGAWLPAVRANCKTFDYGGEPTEEQLENDPRFHEWPDGWISMRTGKKAAGRYLFDEVYSEFPKASVTP